MASTTKEIIIPIVTFVTGMFLGIIIGYYLFKKQVQKLQKQFESMDKEQVRNMLSAFGQKPSEEQVNRIVNTVKSMNKKKTLKDKKKK